ncbi:TolC family protein [Pedobacter chinensis]|uniref:TolC family protein n=1 Tax=Pedobacter chinensis TaxID=2282421 RepID=A0A369PVS2_9SPHI|nr:TolC family protein [Pedobacter chinensis]RDC56362.1 TolC family protein [Pedobacter chinensis]
MTHITKIATKIGMFLALMPLPGRAQSNAPGLAELIESAIKKDYALANKQLDIETTSIDAKKLKEAHLPRIDISGKGAYTTSSFNVNSHELIVPLLNINIQQGSNRFTSSSYLVNTQIATGALLYSGGRIPNLRKALSQKITAEKALLEKDRQEIISEIMIAYDQLALLKQIRVVLDESEKRLSANRKTSDKAFGYGLITKYEHQKIEVAQAQLNSRIQEYEGKRSLVLYQLHLLTDMDLASLALINNSLTVLKVSENNATVENRSEIKALQAVITANEFNIKAEKSWFLPKVQAGASLGYIGFLNGNLKSREPVIQGGNKLSSDLPNLNILPVFTVGIGAKWDLFDGMAGKRDVQKAKIELYKAQNEKKEVTEKLELNLYKSWTDYNTANAQIEVKEKQREISKNALTQATKEYQTGLIKSLQLIDAENDLQNASLEHIQAIYMQRRTAVNLLKATGNLTIQSIK